MFSQLWLIAFNTFLSAVIIKAVLFLICNPTREVYEERIASYWKIFQSHKEYYCQNPLAQKLLTLQAEKEEIESRLKACDDQITVKQKELELLTVSTIFISSQYAVVEPRYLQLFILLI